MNSLFLFVYLLNLHYNNDDMITGKISTFSFREDGCSFVYCPSLDLVGYGLNAKEANDSFKVVLYEYLKYTTENGTLEADLAQHGWRNNKQPSPSSMIGRNKELKRVLDKGISVSMKQVKIPSLS